MVVQRLARFRTNLGNLRISQDICYVRMTDNNGFLFFLLNNNWKYLLSSVYDIYFDNSNIPLSFY